MKNNGCNEDGWDLYEENTRKEFEFYARKQGYNLERDKECPWIYSDNITEGAWRMYHQAHVRGREFQIKRTLG